MKALCHLNGRILPLSEARIDPLDRGFLFGDALYEVVKVRSGIVFELDAHLDRMSRTFEQTGIGEPPDLAAACRELVEAVELDTGFLYMQVTRGVAPRTHLPPAGMTPTVFILPALYDFDSPASRKIRTISERDYRWRKCDIKSTSLIATVLGKVSAESAGADEILFVSGDGVVREGGQTNFFVRRDDALETHPADHRILPGVTRQLLLGLAREAGLPLNETAPRLSQRADWQEAFICGTLTGVQPVVELDGEPIAGGRVGEWTQRLAAANEHYELEWITAAARLVATPIEG